MMVWGSVVRAALGGAPIPDQGGPVTTTVSIPPAPCPASRRAIRATCWAWARPASIARRSGQRSRIKTDLAEIICSRHNNK